MEDITIIIFIVTVVMFVSVTLLSTNDNKGLCNVTSSIDGRSYKVRELSDKSIAADYLAKVRVKLVTFTDKLTRDFPNDIRVKRLKKLFTPCTLFENNPSNNGFTTFTHNKCDKMGICLRSQNKPYLFVKINTLMFVLIHELAHIMSVKNDPKHKTEEFWNNFRFVLSNAESYGLWIYRDYSKYPETYCGRPITNNPY